ncbi:GNAT family N-acetyltransferase [Breoghania sp. L-A4]|uniref:GNAT family N-acetyltransferase n=1 Tax=Breoghania sp. L-A4 TaxID=2304600 RepID=UPI000E35F384|nr:GNAT family N-acetyltransferase [Breoghania sp. L-A4]AXS38757.1 GNAT family N-acetyltransferase [Breoghania sp. L-A4]
MATMEIKALGPEAAHQLAPLIAAYAQERKRGAPRRPDDYYAETLLKDKTAELIGAIVDGKLVGFATFFDLPLAISGLRAGQIDDIFVIQDKRRTGIGRRMVEALVTEGEHRGWAHLRWLVPARDEMAAAFFEHLAEPAGWNSYIIRIDRLADV